MTLIGGRLASASRPVAYGVVVGAYVVATLAGVVTALLGPGHPLVRTLAADVVATVVIFAVSTVVNNASLYDPYWSVAPPVIVIGWLVAGLGADGVAVRQFVVVALVVVWAARLTANWASGWRGLSHEDWRYLKLRDEAPVPFWLVNLGGIQLMPTVLVYLGLLSAWPALTAGGRPFGPVDVLAILVTGGSIAMEAVADVQLRRFTADPSHRGLVADVGLWRLSRHPNYLGEIGFWCGLFLFGLAANPASWLTIVGPIAMVLLFSAVSVPMMDQRSLARRPGYADYARQVPPLLPRPRRPRT